MLHLFHCHFSIYLCVMPSPFFHQLCLWIKWGRSPFLPLSTCIIIYIGYRMQTVYKLNRSHLDPWAIARCSVSSLAISKASSVLAAPCAA